jgi:hypothetical protein
LQLLLTVAVVVPIDPKGNLLHSKRPQQRHGLAHLHWNWT